MKVINVAGSTQNLHILYFPFPGLEQKAQAGDHFQEIAATWQGAISTHTVRNHKEAQAVFMHGFNGVVYLFAHSTRTQGVALESGEYLSAESALHSLPKHAHKWPQRVILNTCHAEENGWAEVFRSRAEGVQSPGEVIALREMARWGRAMLDLNAEEKVE